MQKLVALVFFLLCFSHEACAWGSAAAGPGGSLGVRRSQRSNQPGSGRPRTALGLSMNGMVDLKFVNQNNKIVKAKIGTPLSQVAKKAGAKVRYSCKEGNCATCEINIDGRNVKACVGKVRMRKPPAPSSICISWTTAILPRAFPWLPLPI
ncbi:unnamed protein product [Chrysoparadoxa australica]